MQREGKKIKVGVVYIDTSPDFVKRFNIKAYPTYLLFQHGSHGDYTRYFGENKANEYKKFVIHHQTKKEEETIILRYFQARGRAEIIRLTMEACGLSYHQELHSSEEWPEIKKNGYESGLFPFGQVPSLMIDQQDLVQTSSIVRYIGTKCGLILPKFATHIDILMEGVEDLRRRYSKLVYSPTFVNDKDDYLNDVLPPWLGHFERYLSKTQSDYLVGDILSVADLALFEIVTANLAV